MKMMTALIIYIDFFVQVGLYNPPWQSRWFSSGKNAVFHVARKAEREKSINCVFNKRQEIVIIIALSLSSQSESERFFMSGVSFKKICRSRSCRARNVLIGNNKTRFMDASFYLLIAFFSCRHFFFEKKDWAEKKIKSMKVFSGFT